MNRKKKQDQQKHMQWQKSRFRREIEKYLIRLFLQQGYVLTLFSFFNYIFLNHVAYVTPNENLVGVGTFLHSDNILKTKMEIFNKFSTHEIFYILHIFCRL